MKYDVAVIGVGTMGSAAAYHLAKRGCGVIAFEQFQIVHELGSHSGQTRIIRHAYHESPDYVPLVLRADDLWLELEAINNQPLLIRTGAVVLGPPNCELVRGAILACQTHQLPHEKISAAEVMKRWPQFRLPEDWQCCFDPKAGFLLVDPCIKTHVREAARNGAQVNENENILSLETHGSGFRMTTNKASYEAARLVVCAGSWTSKILTQLQLPLVVKRKTLTWLRPRNAAEFSVGRFPIFLAEKPEGLLYGFPIHGHPGIKIANHSSAGPATNPDTIDRNFQDSDALDIKDFVRNHLPDVTEEILDGKVCLYTLTPDEDFVLDFHPHDKRIVIAAGFSGHGFKFAPVIGEILADLSLEGTTRHPIQRFRISRFTPAAPGV